MSTMWLKDKLLSGSQSWDYNLMKLLGMLLQSALVTRVGDVGRSDLYHGPKYMTYGDVELHILPNSPLAIQSSKATFKI